MHPANSYSRILEVLSERFRSGYTHRNVLTGIVLARPQTPIARDEILPHISYWNFRSDNYTDFFFAGYGEDGAEGIPEDGNYEVSISGRKWIFNNQLYVEFLEEMRHRTKWRPSGGADLILANAKFVERRGRAEIDFSTSLPIDLDLAKKLELFLDVSHFFEQVFEFARKVNESRTTDNPAWDLSDALGIQLVGNSLKEGLIAFLPESIRANARRAFVATTRDLSE